MPEYFVCLRVKLLCKSKNINTDFKIRSGRFCRTLLFVILFYYYFSALIIKNIINILQSYK